MWVYSKWSHLFERLHNKSFLRKLNFIKKMCCSYFAITHPHNTAGNQRTMFQRGVRDPAEPWKSRIQLSRWSSIGQRSSQTNISGPSQQMPSANDGWWSWPNWSASSENRRSGSGVRWQGRGAIGLYHLQLFFFGPAGNTYLIRRQRKPLAGMYVDVLQTLSAVLHSCCLSYCEKRTYALSPG